VGHLSRIFRPMAASALTCQKDEFSVPEGLHYLNCAYMAPLPKAVEAAGVAGIRYRSLTAGTRTFDFFEDPDRVRALFAQLVHAPDPQRVAIIPSVSYGIALCARNITLSAGQNVVVLHEQFPSGIYAWRRLTAAAGASVRVVRPPENIPLSADRARQWNARLLDAIDKNTAVVGIEPLHWADGTLFDLEAVGTRCREVGAALIVDGTQSLGALPFDVQRVQPDALIVAAYKWLLGPIGIGAVYLGPRFDDGVPLEETWLGRRGSSNLRGLTDYVDDYADGMVRFDMGGRANMIFVPMMAAALELLLAWEPARIQDYCAQLTRPLVARASTLGYDIAPESDRAAHLFGLHPPAGIQSETIARGLAERHVAVSVRGRAIRVSPNVYNSEEDVAALCDALAATH
jgi:selenocysteine lyase/cysteine desulfurase